MVVGISQKAKQELLAIIRDHYNALSKKDSSRILDEFIAVTGRRRKHGIRLLDNPAMEIVWLEKRLAGGNAKAHCYGPAHRTESWTPYR